MQNIFIVVENSNGWRYYCTLFSNTYVVFFLLLAPSKALSFMLVFVWFEQWERRDQAPVQCVLFLVVLMNLLVTIE